MLLGLSIASLLCAAIPARLTRLNLREYPPPPPAASDLQPVSVIVPARNEAAGIAACVESVLASRGCGIELLVLDDGSTDETATIVEAIAARDSRVRLLRGVGLPPGWNGKQHACWLAAQQARGGAILFLDADVRLHGDAVARMATLLRQEGSSLVSGFPKQITETWMERLLIPLIHFVLLGLLPMRGLQQTAKPAYAAGCGQFLMVEREAYFTSGGHAAIRATMHDGLLLPRLLRQHHFRTRLADLTALASCRMYHDAKEVWNGLAKNATEGLAAPLRIVPMTLLLGFGQVLPLPLLLYALVLRRWEAAAVSAAAAVLSYLPRLWEAPRFEQSRWGARMHPIGMAALLALQWNALGRKVLRRPATWKQRAYAAN